MTALNSIDPTFVLANRIEAGLWFLIALTLLITSRQQRKSARFDGRVAALVFALFGVSDIVESGTGAWYRPWWLLLWKGVCVAALVVLVIRYVLRSRDDHPS